MLPHGPQTNAVISHNQSPTQWLGHIFPCMAWENLLWVKATICRCKPGLLGVYGVEISLPRAPTHGEQWHQM